MKRAFSLLVLICLLLGQSLCVSAGSFDDELAAWDRSEFVSRYDPQALLENYAGDTSAYWRFLENYYRTALYPYDEAEGYYLDFINAEMCRARNILPHSYLAGYTDQAGEVTISGFRAKSLYAFNLLTHCSPSEDLTGLSPWEIFDLCSVPDVIIPNTIDDQPVTKIADYAFYPVTSNSIKTLVISDHVREIGRSAFEDSPVLTTVAFGKETETIGCFAFSRCTQLGSISNWGQALRRIEQYAFGGSVLKTIPPLPDTLEYIGGKAFSGALLGTSPYTLTIPKGVKTMAADVFERCDISLVVLNKNMTIERTNECPLISEGTNGVLYCYAGSTAEENAKQFGYTYYLIDGDSLRLDEQVLEGDVLPLEGAMTEAQLRARLGVDGTSSEIRIDGMRNGYVVEGSTVTLWNVQANAPGKVYTVRKAPAITTVSLGTPPTKLQYKYKEAFDPAGLTLTVTFDDGHTETVAEGFTLRGTEDLSVGTHTVAAEYAGQSVAFDVTVAYTWWQQLIRIFLFGWIWY